MIEENEDFIEDEVLNESLEEGSDLYEHLNIVVDKNQEPLRIDKFLLIFRQNSSRNKISQTCRAGNVVVNGVPVKQNYRVKPNDQISVLLAHPPRENVIIPQDIPINIVYEDDDVLVVDKEAGMVVHPGFGNWDKTLVNAVAYHFEKNGLKTDLDRVGLVHRIDKDTSGLLVIAKNEYAMSFLAKQFFERKTKRLYWAFVWGNLENDGKISLKLTGNLNNNNKITSSGDLNITAKNISNNGSNSVIGSEKNMKVTTDFLKNEGNLLFGEGVTNKLKVAENIINSGVIASLGKIDIDAKNILNDKHIVSDNDLTISTNSITNKGLLYSTGNMKVDFKDNFLNDKADIYSSGDITFTGKDGNFTNKVGNIESEKNIHLLIDEPEISLHIEWQLKFMDDLLRIAEKKKFKRGLP